MIASPSLQDGREQKRQLDLITNREQEWKGVHRQHISFERLRLPFLVRWMLPKARVKYIQAVASFAMKNVGYRHQHQLSYQQHESLTVKQQLS